MSEEAIVGRISFGDHTTDDSFPVLNIYDMMKEIDKVLENDRAQE